MEMFSFRKSIKAALKNNLSEEEVQSLRNVRDGWNNADSTTKRRAIAGTVGAGVVVAGGLPVLAGVAAVSTVVWGVKGEINDRARKKMLEHMEAQKAAKDAQAD